MEKFILRTSYILLFLGFLFFGQFLYEEFSNESSQGKFNDTYNGKKKKTEWSNPYPNKSQFYKVNKLSDLKGTWSLLNGNDFLHIDTDNKKLWFNDGGKQIFTYEDDGSFFFINAYIGNNETFAASLKIKGNRKEINVNRIDGGVDGKYYKTSNLPNQ